MMAASGREIRGEGKRARGWAPSGERGKRERSRKQGTRRWRAGGAPRCQGWIEKTAARGSAARRKGRGGISRAGGKREGASRPGARARRWGRGGGRREGGARAEAPAARGRGAGGSAGRRLVPERRGGSRLWIRRL